MLTLQDLPLWMFPHLTPLCGRMKGAVPFILGFLIQLLIGGNSIVIKMAFRADMKFTVFLCYKNTVAFFALLVAALYSKRRPPVPKGWLLAYIICLGMLEPFLGQLAVFAGLRFTPASFSSCIIAAGPALTFFLSWWFKSEKVNIRERPSQAKLLGVLMVITGGIVVSQIDGPTITIAHSSTSHGGLLKYTKNWVRGPVLVGTAVVLSVCYNLLMQRTTNEYPDFPLIWLNAYAVSIGALMDTIVAVALTGSTTYAWMLGLNVKLACYLYSGLVVSAFTAWLQSLVIKMRGAVFLSFFSPLATVIVMVLGVTVLKEDVDTGSIVGGCVIVTGLFVFQWAKWRQTQSELPQ
ncbi:WAT1-related protein [Pyrus ussuriensis x Pyrus communis]|uniref:WAT1-related protein n=1 Tax=Pyrus ussuriensis x Pyrus communis TaxID=2448454 RepID=A0A5N5FR36_9ROSA|nr:WAT1-related protein [Pyrus ussuriensis x Pyrus communis]